MSQSKFVLLPLRSVAVLIVCSFFAVAHADEGDATLGVQSSVTLPAQAQGNPPPWA